MWRVLVILCLLSATEAGITLRAQPATNATQNIDRENYESVLNQALKAEGLQNYTEAIRLYVRAIKMNPERPLAKERIVQILVTLKGEGKSTAELEVLLPVDFKDDLVQLGVISGAGDQAATLQTLMKFFWGFVGLLVLGLIIFVISMIRRRASGDDETSDGWTIASNRKKTRKAAAPTSGAPTKGASTEAGKPAFHITEKTREEISGILTSVKSLTGSQQRPAGIERAPSAEEMKALEESGVLTALAETMISDVKTEETPEGRLSKMMLDASLVFDETDLPPDLDEWRAEHGDEAVEKYLDRLHKREKK